MHVLFFGTYDASVHPRVAVLRDGLADSGASVSECNVPLSLSTAQRVAILKNPARLPWLAWRLLVCWSGLVRRSRAWRRAGAHPDAVVVGYLGHFDVLLARRLFPRTTIVLDHLTGGSDTARDRGVGRGWRQGLLRRLDAAALGAADVVVVDTAEHLEGLAPDVRGRSLVVAVGATSAWFDAARTDETVGAPLRTIFFGLFTPLQGTPVIGQALAALAGEPIEVTMIGTGQEYAETRRHAAGNDAVRWVDWVPPAELPSLVAQHDVCLGIFGDGPKALRVVPTKMFQGAAAGCAVVTSDTAPQRRVLGDAALFAPAGDPQALADLLRSLAHDHDRLAAARSAAHERAVEDFAPERVVAPLFRRLRAHALQEDVS